MSTESDLKNMLGDAGPALGHVDLARVLRRSSRRRLAQQLTVGSAMTLAVAGIGVAGFTGVRGLTPSTTAGSASSAKAPETKADPSLGSTATDRGITRAPADKINLCGGTLAEVAPNADGLLLTTSFPTADASADRITGTVTLTNSGSEHITGTSTATPAITLSKDGVVLWHSNGPTIAMAAVVDLAPGASLTYQASFRPVSCAIEDDSADSFRSDLPHVAAGQYQVSAALDLSRQNLDGAFLSTDLVTGPVSEVTVR